GRRSSPGSPRGRLCAWLRIETVYFDHQLRHSEMNYEQPEYGATKLVAANTECAAYRGSTAIPAAWLREALPCPLPSDVRASASDVIAGHPGSDRARRRRSADYRAVQPPGCLHPVRRYGGCVLQSAFPEDLVAHPQ